MAKDIQIADGVWQIGSAETRLQDGAWVSDGGGAYLVDDQTKLALITDARPGDLAFTAGYKKSWQLDTDGTTWVEFEISSAETAAEAAQASAEAAAASAATATAVKNSIPQSYTDLSNDVVDLKSAFDGVFNSSNIFDPSKIKVGGYYDNNGVLKSQADSIYYEDYIELNESKTIYYYRNDNPINTLSFIAYDSSKDNPTRTQSTTQSAAITFGSDKAYIRFSLYGGAAFKNTLQISFEPLIDNKSAQLMASNVVMAQTQLNQAKNYIEGKHIHVAWHGTYGSSTSGLYIYIPATYGYIRYDFRYYKNIEGKNADIWRIHSIYTTDDNLETRYRANVDGEIECAIKLSGRSDYSGGMMHGDEIFTNLNFILNGEVYSAYDFADLVFTGSNNDLVCDGFSILETSDMYDPADGTTKFAVHGREYTISTDGIALKQSVKWLVTESVADCYMAMLTPSKDYTDTLYTDTNFAPQNALSAYGDYPNAGAVTLYSNTAGFTCGMEMISYPSGLTGGDKLNVRDNGGAGYNKCYFYVCEDTQVQSGTIWKSNVKYTANAWSVE